MGVIYAVAKNGARKGLLSGWKEKGRDIRAMKQALREADKEDIDITTDQGHMHVINRASEIEYELNYGK